MNIKLVKIASVREHMDAHYRGEISYSKAVDLINEDANKQLRIGAVVEGRELLKGFASKFNDKLDRGDGVAIMDWMIDEFLETL